MNNLLRHTPSLYLNVAHYENMTSSRKPEVHNVLHCHQRRTEPRPENSVKFRHAVFELREWTDRQTYKQTCCWQYFAALLGQSNRYEAIATVTKSNPGFGKRFVSRSAVGSRGKALVGGLGPKSPRSW